MSLIECLFSMLANKRPRDFKKFNCATKQVMWLTVPSLEWNSKSSFIRFRGIKSPIDVTKVTWLAVFLQFSRPKGQKCPLRPYTDRFGPHLVVKSTWRSSFGSWSWKRLVKCLEKLGARTTGTVRGGLVVHIKPKWQWKMLLMNKFSVSNILWIQLEKFFW